MASKRKLNQSVSLAHFGFTSKKVALRDEDACAGSTVGPLATRTEDPLPPSGSTEEQGEIEAECSEDAAGAEVTLAAAASTSHLPPGWRMKQVDEWKYRNPWLDIKAGKLGCLVCRKAKSLLLSEKGLGLHLAEEWINGNVTGSEEKRLRKKIQTQGQSGPHKVSGNSPDEGERHLPQHFH